MSAPGRGGHRPSGVNAVEEGKEMRPVAPSSAIPLKIEVPGMTEGLYLPLPRFEPVRFAVPSALHRV